MGDEEKRAFWVNSIMEKVNSVENVDFLIYLNRLIENIMKAGR